MKRNLENSAVNVADVGQATPFTIKKILVATVELGENLAIA